MNTESLSRGWALISEGAALIADAYASVDPAAARAAVPGAQAPAGSAAGVVPPAPVAPSLQEQHIETVLGECPDHQVPWEVKAGGISKAGKPYPSFWRCNQRTADGYCQKRPVKAWVDSHPIREAA